MREILVEQARRKAAAKRGGDLERVELSESKLVGGAPDEELLAINEALDRLNTLFRWPEPARGSGSPGHFGTHGQTSLDLCTDLVIS
jgi:hypothetical protein